MTSVILAAIAHNFLKLQEKDRLKMLAQFLPERSEHAFQSKFDGQELNVAAAGNCVDDEFKSPESTRDIQPTGKLQSM